MIRLVAWLTWVVIAPIASSQYEPPAGYYASATGSGTTLKQRIHNIIDSHTMYYYSDLRTLLQVTDADPDHPGHILLAYDRVSLDISNIGGSIPGWDTGFSWNREHTWPRSRGIGSSGPDNSDLHHIRASDPGVNSDRGNLNFGGAFGQPYGMVQDGGIKWYPGDTEAGMIARQQFYMAVRYDGSDIATDDLELAAGNPGSTLGDKNRLVEWHYAAPPDVFERRRNQIVYDYQGNRNPFVDHPEWVWSVFVDQQNDSRITLLGATADQQGGTTSDVSLGRYYVDHPLPLHHAAVVNKSGSDGTYYRVTGEGLGADSPAVGVHAMRTGQTDSNALVLSNDIDVSVAGAFTGTLTIDNLDITTGGGEGRGARDADDVIHLSLDVLNHPVASLAEDFELRNHVIEMDDLVQGSGVVDVFAGSIVNLASPFAPDFAAELDLDAVLATGDTNKLSPDFAADLDLDAVLATGDTNKLSLDLTTFAGLGQGDSYAFSALVDTTTIGSYSSTFELLLSGEDLLGEQTQVLSLTLLAEVVAPGLDGDFNGDGMVNLVDYIVWRDHLGSAFELAGNGIADGVVDTLDYAVWKANFGSTSGHMSASHQVPEPRGLLLLGPMFGLGIVVVRLQVVGLCRSGCARKIFQAKLPGSGSPRRSWM